MLDTKNGQNTRNNSPKAVLPVKTYKNSLQTEKSLHLAFMVALNNRIYRLVLHGWRQNSVLSMHYRSSPCFNSPSPP